MMRDTSRNKFHTFSGAFVTFKPLIRVVISGCSAAIALKNVIVIGFRKNTTGGGGVFPMLKA